MKLTKKCLYPWSYMQFHAGGMMQPCCVGPDTDMGDLIIDYIEKKKRDVDKDIFNSDGLISLREGMLTGNLRPMCQNCFFISNQLQTVEEFKKQLTAYLGKEEQNSNGSDSQDLTRRYRYDWMAISFTNRCNLSCVYCVQSVLKDKNPYFKAEIPYEYTEDILGMMISKGIKRLSTCVEGEATLYRYWYNVFHKFHESYPAIELVMTTNLCRKFSEEEIELLTDYTILDISIDSLKPGLYQKLRRNGNLELVIENLNKIDDKVKQLGIQGPRITLHVVVSDQTWTEIEDVAEFAFDRGYGIQLGNYEERINTTAYQTGILKPIQFLSEEDQYKAWEIITRVRKKAQKEGRVFITQGDIFRKIDEQVNKVYHRFTITDNNEVYKKYLEVYPKGTINTHFSIVYDRDNISYSGIELRKGECLTLTDLPKNLNLVLRSVLIYKEGSVSPKFKHRIAPGYRRKEILSDGRFEYTADIKDVNVEAVLLDISETWIMKTT